MDHEDEFSVIDLEHDIKYVVDGTGSRALLNDLCLLHPVNPVTVNVTPAAEKFISKFISNAGDPMARMARTIHEGNSYALVTEVATGLKFFLFPSSTYPNDQDGTLRLPVGSKYSEDLMGCSIVEQVDVNKGWGNKIHIKWEDASGKHKKTIHYGPKKQWQNSQSVSGF